MKLFKKYNFSYITHQTKEDERPILQIHDGGFSPVAFSSSVWYDDIITNQGENK